MPVCFPSWFAECLRSALVLLALTAAPCWSRDHEWDAWSRLQGDVYAALLAQGVADRDRVLVHLAHTCTLVKAGGAFHIVEIRELVHGGRSPRGVNSLVILDDGLRVVASVELGPVRPYYCESDQVVLDSEVAAGGPNRVGNVLIVDEAGQVVEVRRQDAADMAGFQLQRPAPARSRRRQP